MQVVKSDFHSVKKSAFTLHAPFSGRVLPQSESTNPLVRNELLGLGVTIEVTNYQLFAPASSTLISVSQAGCEFIFKSSSGVKILVLLTLSDAPPFTGFKQHTQVGQHCEQGMLVASYDFRSQTSPVYASVLLLETAKLSRVIDKCIYQANRVTAQNDILLKLTKRINND